MSNQIRRWKNSLAICIPKAFAEKIGLQADDELELMVQDGQLILALEHKSALLDDLLGDVTEESQRDERDMGSAVGKEVW